MGIINGHSKEEERSSADLLGPQGAQPGNEEISLPYAHYRGSSHTAYQSQSVYGTRRQEWVLADKAG